MTYVDAIDADIASLEGLLARRRVREELEHAEGRVRFWQARAADSVEFGRTDLAVTFHGLAETWAEIADACRKEMGADHE